jgi:predicted Zn-dependent protease
MGLAALGAGWAVIPRPRELALMRLRDKQFDRALFDYEARYKSGDRSAPTVGALTEIYLQHGDVPKAIELIEGHLQRHPGDVAARRRLGTYYQYAQQPLRYVANLELLLSGTPSEEDLRELSRAYSFFHRPADQVRTLQRLVEHGYARTEDVLDLANLLGSLGKTGEAADLLASRKTLSGGMVEMLVRLRLDAAQPEEAIAVVKRAVIGETDDSAARLVAVLAARGQKIGAREAVAALGDRALRSPELLAQWTQVETGMGQTGPAFARLDALAAERKLPCALTDAWMELALRNQRRDRVIGAILNPVCPIDKTPLWLAEGLLEASISANRLDAADTLSRLFGDRLARGRPLLAFAWAIARGDKTGAAAALGEAAEAASTDAMREEVAGHYARLGHLDRALVLAERARSRQTLLDIYYLASDSKLPALRLRAANALVAAFDSAQVRLLRASAYADLARPVEALADLRPLRNQPEAGELYGRVLREAALKHPVGAELAAWARPRLGGPDRQELVELLRVQKQWDLALPAMAELAREKGDPWFWNFVESARTAGRNGMLVEFLQVETNRTDLAAHILDQRVDLLAEESIPAALSHLAKRAGRPGLPPDDQRALAWRLLAGGDKSSARGVFERLAAKAGPDSKDVEQLLHLWGEKPGEKETGWLLQRARAAVGAERSAWIERIVQAGAASQVDSIESGGDPQVREALLRAHQTARNLSKFRELLSEAVGSGGTPAELRRYARLAREESMNDLAAQSFQQLLIASPSDGEALRESGKLAYSEGRYNDAGRFLLRAEHDAESLLLAGDLAKRASHLEEARQKWALALAANENKLLEAQLLARLEPWDRASEAFEALVRAESKDENVKAEYASALLERGRLAEAAKVLDTEGPGIRLEQLRAQLAAAKGDTNSAARRLSALVDREPGNPQLWAQAASVEYQAGRRRRAANWYGRAKQLSPRREDWDEAIEQIRSELVPESGVEATAKSIGPGWREFVSKLAGEVRVSPAWTVGASMEVNRVSLVNFDGTIRRGTLSAAWEGETGRKLSLELYRAERNGAGASYSWLSGRGRTTVNGAYAKPYWEYMEGLAGAGTRSRAAIEHQQPWGKRGAACVALHANQYGLRGAANAGRTSGVSGGTSFAIKRPLVAQYGVDREMVHSRNALPLLSREVHAFTGAASGDWKRKLRWEASGGYAVDRLGGRGPYTSGSVLWTPTPNLRAGVWFDRRLNTIATVAGSAVQLRFGVWWKQ